MKMPKSIEDSLKTMPWEQELRELREILIGTELEEGLKWGIPHYIINKN